MKVNVEGIGIDGTHFQGEFSSSFQKIKSLFGDPILSVPGDKTQAEWRIQFDELVRDMNHDWKEWGTSYENVENWHVGGYNRKAFDAVKSMLRTGGKFV